MKYIQNVNPYIRLVYFLRMKIVDKPISKQELQKIASDGFGNLVKALVDVSKEIMVIDASLHFDKATQQKICDIVLKLTK